MGKFADTSCREYQNTYITFSNFFFENCNIYETMWKNIVEPNGPQMTVWHMRIACWIPKATNTYAEDVMLIVFPLQQWLHERTSVSRAYIACLSQ